MAVSAPPWVIQQLFDNDGLLNAGGTLEFYVAGSSTPQAVYTDATGDQACENPLTLDSSGRCQFWLTAGLAYKIIQKDADGVVLTTIDGVTVDGSSSSGSATQAYDIAVDTAKDVWADQTPLFVFNAPRAISFAGDFAGSPFGVEVYDSTPVVVTLKFAATPGASATTVGSITIPATSGALVLATTDPSGFSLAYGNQLRLIPPEGGMGAVRGLSGTFAGTVA